MAILDEKMTASILERVAGNSDREKWETLARENPWYPLPWLMLAETDAQKQKAALWFKNEHRIHWLLRNGQVQEDEWLQEHLTASSTPATTIEENPVIPAETASVPVEEELIDEVVIPENKRQQAIETAENQSSSIEADETAQLDFQPLAPAEDALDIRLDEKELVEELEAKKSDVALNLPGPAESAPGLPATPEATDANHEEGKKQEETVDATAAAENVTIAPEETSQASDSSEKKFLFEPLFTTDYFASQGIKIDLNAVPQTNFDRQVKTFTQWLKTMKRIAPETNLPADPMVDAQASASVVGKEVITEAMAEVLEKQGKYQKAIEILAKLILLHPEKSAFFAAQIEKLKALQ